MKYEVIITETFKKEVEKLKDKKLEKQIYTKLLELETEPKRFKKLRYELKEYYRLRIGKFRILFRVVGNKVYVEALIKRHKY